MSRDSVLRNIECCKKLLRTYEEILNAPEIENEEAVKDSAQKVLDRLDEYYAELERIDAVGGVDCDLIQ